MPERWCGLAENFVKIIHRIDFMRTVRWLLELVASAGEGNEARGLGSARGGDLRNGVVDLRSGRGWFLRRRGRRSGGVGEYAAGVDGGFLRGSE